VQSHRKVCYDDCVLDGEFNNLNVGDIIIPRVALYLYDEPPYAGQGHIIGRFCTREVIILIGNERHFCKVIFKRGCECDGLDESSSPEIVQ
jgi:hypothetical protein